VRPVLVKWSGRHGHLREVTRSEIIAARDAVHGNERENRVVALRSLFRHAKKAGTIFKNPTVRIHVGRQPGGVILSLSADEVAETVAVATTPAVRLIVALAAVHAARPTAIRHLLLETWTSATAA
jgi:site-specific recombinase XerD